MPSQTRSPLAAWERLGRSCWIPGVALYSLLVASQLGRRDLLNDELYSVAAVHHLGEALRQTHGTMALYYVVLQPWSRVSLHPVWLHLPSALAMAASVGVLARVVERWHGNRAGRWAGIYAASSFLLVRHGVEARSYAMWTLAVACGWLFLDRSVQAEDRRSRLGFAACVVAMPLLHGLAGVVLVGYLVAIAWCRPPRRLALGLVAPILVGLATIAVLVLGGAGEVGTQPAMDLAVGRRFLRGLVFPGVRPALVLLLVAAVGARRAVALAGTDRAADRLRRVGLIVWGPGAASGLVLLSLVRPALAFRYAGPSALGLAGLLAVATTGVRRAAMARLAPAGLALLLLVGQTELRLPNHQWRETARHISDRHRPGDGIAFVPADTRLAYEATIAAHPVDEVPPLVGAGDPLGTFDRFGSVDDPQAIGAAATRSDRLWVVSIRAGTEPTRDLVADLFGHPSIREPFRVSDRVEIGDVTIWMLDRASSEVD